ncbi:MAG: hypothetical protein E7B29_11315, partial [Mixta calida]|nr:hypothetical protein [Mixta calida]
KEMRVAMTLTGARSIAEITRDSLVQAVAPMQPDALAQAVAND